MCSEVNWLNRGIQVYCLIETINILIGASLLALAKSIYYRSIGKSEKGFAKPFSWTAVFFLLIMHARARLLFLSTICQILFRISQWNGKKEIQKQISQIRNPDFEIRIQISQFECTLKKRSIAMWSAQYDRWKKKTDSSQNTKKVLLTYTLFHNKIHNFFFQLLSLTFKKSTRNNCY